jgi:DNA-binding transcriptional ArsR family regulator
METQGLRNPRKDLRNLNTATLDALFPKTRQDILAATLLDPKRSWYLSDLARHLRTQPSSLQRELAALAEAGILRRRTDGNRVYFQADVDSPCFEELRGLMLKAGGAML